MPYLIIALILFHVIKRKYLTSENYNITYSSAILKFSSLQICTNLGIWNLAKNRDQILELNHYSCVQIIYICKWGFLL